MSLIPILNKEYNCFDDGKLRPSRLYKVIVREIIPFDKIDSKTLSQWEGEVKTYYWLYRETTDFFIRAVDGDGKDEFFVRTKDNGWFSMGFMDSGQLDIDGTLYAEFKEIYE